MMTEEDEDALFARWSAESDGPAAQPPRFSHTSVLEETSALLKHHLRGIGTAPALEIHEHDEPFYAALSLRERGTRVRIQRKQTTLDRWVLPRASEEPDPFTPQPNLVEFVRKEREKNPDDFDPAEDEGKDGANVDPGVLSALYPLDMDKRVYLRTAEGDHTYYVRGPGGLVGGTKMRRRYALSPSASQLVQAIHPEPPFDAHRMAHRTADARKRKLALALGVSGPRADDADRLGALQRTLATASVAEIAQWSSMVGGSFDAETLKREWKAKGDSAAALGTITHRYIECYFNQKDDQVNWNSEAMRKFRVFLDENPWYDRSDRLKCRTELSLYYEPWDIAGQADFVVFLDDDYVDVLDWKCIGKSYEEIRKKLRGYEPQLMFYYWMMRNSGDPVLSKLKLRKLVLVALSPCEAVREPIVHEFPYRKEPVEKMLEVARATLQARFDRMRLHETPSADLVLDADPPPPMAQTKSAQWRPSGRTL